MYTIKLRDVSLILVTTMPILTHTVGSTREEVRGIPQPQNPRVFEGAVSKGLLSRFSSCSRIKKLDALLTIFLWE